MIQENSSTGGKQPRGFALLWGSVFASAAVSWWALLDFANQLSRSQSLCLRKQRLCKYSHMSRTEGTRPHWRVCMPVAGLICGRCSGVEIKGLALSQWRADTAKAEIIWESLHLQLKGHLWMTVLTSKLHLKNAMTMSAFIGLSDGDLLFSFVEA